MKAKKQVLFVFFFFLFLLSCHPSKREYLRTFDLPLMKQTEEFLLSGNLNAGINLNKKYLAIADEEKYQAGKATCYINLALINSFTGNYKNSLLFLQNAESILKDSNDMIHKAYLYINYGMFNSDELFMHDMAYKYFNKALYCLNRSEDSETKQYLLQLVYVNKSRFQKDSSLIYLHKARNIKKDVVTEGMTALAHFQKNELDSTRIYVNNAFKMANKEKLLNGNHIYLYFVAGTYYQKMHQYKKAEEAYQNAVKITLATKETFGGSLRWLYLDLVKLYKETGDKKKEHEYTDLYHAEREKFETNQIKAANLSTKNFITAIKNEEKEGKNRIWFFIILSGILIVFISFFVYRKLKQLQVKKRVLQHETKKLKDQITDKSYHEIIELARKNDSAFLMKFQETYPIFIARLREINPDMESSELAFCCLLKLNFTSKEIAAYTFTQHTSVQQRKRRLRKKLNIPSDVDLYVYFNNL